ncbi:MAG: hypothetical protein JO190_06620 [Candidatus Eremiobacteraeota bacterium]|nr:hypothetical protein [Candidatus Eremiobacteraeota bacterium]MBV8499088.1 hypothetical protein [Candidatus Eremiobacteraeota bacterium]
MTTSFVNLLRIDVLSDGTTWLPPADEGADNVLFAPTLDGTAPLPPHADAARIAPTAINVGYF